MAAHQRSDAKETAGAMVAAAVPGSPVSTEMDGPDLFLETGARA